MKLLLSLLSTAVGLFASEHGGHEGGGAGELLWKIANFAILAGGLGYLIAKSAPAFFRSRSEGIRKDIQDAAELKRQAEAKAAEIEARMRNLSADIEVLRQAAAEEAAREADRIRLETAAAVERLQRQANQEIASAAKAARMELRDYSAELAIQLAAERVREGLTPPVQEALVEDLLADLRKKRNAPEVH
jgi:F-type H+-transporting ATPase subunit b